MENAKRRKYLGIKPDPTDLQEKQKKRVMARAKSEKIRPGFLVDLGRSLASNGSESVWCLIVLQSFHYQVLPNQAGISMQIIPSLLTCEPAPPTIGNYILTIECLSKDSPDTIVEYAIQQIAKGVTLRVGYDRAYQSSAEYVVPLMLNATDSGDIKSTARAYDERTSENSRSRSKV